MRVNIQNFCSKKLFGIFAWEISETFVIVIMRTAPIAESSCPENVPSNQYIPGGHSYRRCTGIVDMND